MYKLCAIVDRDKCQAFSACVRVAPDVFSLGLDQVAEVDAEAGAPGETLLRAARSCPFEAIRVFDGATGMPVYPTPEEQI